MAEDRSVVVGVDGTAAADRAALWAARRAAVYGLPLVLVHALRWPAQATVNLRMPSALEVLDPVGSEEPVRRWAREMVEGLAERCRAAFGVEVHTCVVPGDPADAVALAADRTEFVVVGHSAAGGVDRLLLGSTAERLTRSCPWPVVVVRDEATAAEGRPEGPVVVGTDGSSMSDRAVRFAFRFADRSGGDVVVVHVASSSAALLVDPVEIDTDAALRDGRGPVAEQVARSSRLFPAVRSQMHLGTGSAADVLLAFCAGASLLVVGSHGKGALRRAFLGSVSHKVVNSAPCPVAVLPPASGTA